MVRILLKVLKTANIEFIAVILIGILNLNRRGKLFDDENTSINHEDALLSN